MNSTGRSGGGWRHRRRPGHFAGPGHRHHLHHPHRRAGESGVRYLAALLLALSFPAFADSSLPPAYWANRQLPDARQEAAATRLMFEIRCLVCQGQSIADSDAELAGDMRHLIRGRIAAGENPDEVRDWLVERYGNWIVTRFLQCNCN